MTDNEGNNTHQEKKVVEITKVEDSSSITVSWKNNDGTTGETTIEKSSPYKSAASHARYDDDVTATNAALDNKKNQGNNNKTEESQDTSD